MIWYSTEFNFILSNIDVQTHRIEYLGFVSDGERVRCHHELCRLMAYLTVWPDPTYPAAYFSMLPVTMTLAVPVTATQNDLASTTLSRWQPGPTTESYNPVLPLPTLRRAGGPRSRVTKSKSRLSAVPTIPEITLLYISSRARDSPWMTRWHVGPLCEPRQH